MSPETKGRNHIIVCFVFKNIDGAPPLVFPFRYGAFPMRNPPGEIQQEEEKSQFFVSCSSMLSTNDAPKIVSFRDEEVLKRGLQFALDS